MMREFEGVTIKEFEKGRAPDIVEVKEQHSLSRDNVQLVTDIYSHQRVWVELSDGTYYPAVILGKGNYSFYLVKGFDIKEQRFFYDVVYGARLYTLKYDVRFEWDRAIGQRDPFFARQGDYVVVTDYSEFFGDFGQITRLDMSRELPVILETPADYLDPTNERIFHTAFKWSEIAPFRYPAIKVSGYLYFQQGYTYNRIWDNYPIDIIAAIQREIDLYNENVKKPESEPKPQPEPVGNSDKSANPNDEMLASMEAFLASLDKTVKEIREDIRRFEQHFGVKTDFFDDEEDDRGVVELSSCTKGDSDPSKKSE